MAKTPAGAGPLDRLVALDQRQPAADGFGNTVAAWAEQFQADAAFVHVRGSETVMAARLEGRSTMIVRLRSSAASRGVTTDWRLRDVRNGVQFKIHEAVEDSTRAWVDLLVEQGVAT